VPVRSGARRDVVLRVEAFTHEELAAFAHGEDDVAQVELAVAHDEDFVLRAWAERGGGQREHGDLGAAANARAHVLARQDGRVLRVLEQRFDRDTAGHGVRRTDDGDELALHFAVPDPHGDRVTGFHDAELALRDRARELQRARVDQVEDGVHGGHRVHHRARAARRARDGAVEGRAEHVALEVGASEFALSLRGVELGRGELVLLGTLHGVRLRLRPCLHQALDARLRVARERELGRSRSRLRVRRGDLRARFAVFERSERRPRANLVTEVRAHLVDAPAHLETEIDLLPRGDAAFERHRRLPRRGGPFRDRDDGRLVRLGHGRRVRRRALLLDRRVLLRRLDEAQAKRTAEDDEGTDGDGGDGAGAARGAGRVRECEVGRLVVAHERSPGAALGRAMPCKMVC